MESWNQLLQHGNNIDNNLMFYMESVESWNHWNRWIKQLPQLINNFHNFFDGFAWNHGITGIAGMALVFVSFFSLSSYFRAKVVDCGGGKQYQKKRWGDGVHKKRAAARCGSQLLLVWRDGPLWAISLVGWITRRPFQVPLQQQELPLQRELPPLELEPLAARERSQR